MALRKWERVLAGELILTEESELQSLCVSYAEALGIIAARHGRNGDPDYIFVFEGGETVFVEFKRPDGRGSLQPNQVRKIRALWDQGASVYVCESFRHFRDIVSRHTHQATRSIQIHGENEPPILRDRRAGLPEEARKEPVEPGPRKIEMVGRVFGRLTVLHEDGLTSGGARWLCRCSCTRETSVRGTSLRSGHAISCGLGACRRKRKGK